MIDPSDIVLRPPSTVRCARAVRKVGHVGPFFPPMAEATAVTTVLPHAGLLRFLYSVPKTQTKS